MRRYPNISKADALELLELVPQSLWPPRPTRQDAETLRAIVVRAMNNDPALKAAVDKRVAENDTKRLLRMVGR